MLGGGMQGEMGVVYRGSLCTEGGNLLMGEIEFR